MRFITKYKREIIFCLILVISFFLLRALTLKQLPIFTDEAIYLRWAQIAKNDANWRFISLTDGKQPLFIWFVVGAMKFFHDPLIAGRVISVFAGLGTVIGLFFLGREVFKNRYVGLISSFLYVIFPFALVYDRMALYDSLVGTFIVWGLYFTFLLVRNLRLDYALLMGFVTGAAVLNKTNGFFTIYLLPFALVLFDFKKKDSKRKLLRFFALSLLVVVMTYGFYSILRLSPFFYIINEKNHIFFYPISEWIKNPLAFFLPNISAFNDWTLRYVGMPLLLTAGAAFFLSKSYLREKLLLLAWFIIPYIGFALDGKTIYPRYIFPMTLSLLPLIAFSIVSIAHKFKGWKLYLLVILVISYSLVTDFLILYNFPKSPVPNSDKSQYLTGWPSGQGVKEVTDYLTERAKKNPIYVGTEGTFGLMPYALEIAFNNNPNVTVKGFWPINKLPPQELLDAAKASETYVLFYEDCPDCENTGIAPSTWPLQKVLQFKKIEPGVYLTLYRVIIAK